ncbi:hypothetical protein EDD22DRAFT_849952 [Suillus occidentalis]|nr:hypothetical protein EDD22DRAFT_849952 [Suillus occidentalis]
MVSDEFLQFRISHLDFPTLFQKSTGHFHQSCLTFGVQLNFVGCVLDFIPKCGAHTQYYYVVPSSRIIAWLEDLDGYILFQACVKPSEWRHKSKLYTAAVTLKIRGNTEAMTLKQSTAASIFWTLNKMDWITSQLAYVSHHQYLHCHNQPEACLIQTHVIREKPSKFKLLCSMGNTTAKMLCMPITISHIKSTSINGIINGVEVQSFIDDFGSQTRNQITLVYYLQRKAAMFLVITSIPTCFCVLRFLAGITIDFKPSAPSVIACFATLAIVSPVMVQVQLE